MNKAIILFVSLLLGCGKSDSVPDPNIYGEASMQKIIGKRIISVDASWDQTFTLRFDDGSSFSVDSYKGLCDPKFVPNDRQKVDTAKAGAL